MSRQNSTNEKLFLRVLSCKTDKARWNNIATLRSRPDSDVFLRCADLVKSKTPIQRCIGIDILSQLGIKSRPFLIETMELFFEVLEKEDNPEVLHSLFYAIGHNNYDLDPSRVLKLVPFKKHNIFYVRQALVSAISGIDNAKAIETLVFLSKDKVPSIRDWATFGLGTLTERNNQKIREVLWQRVVDSDLDTRMEAIMGLARRKNEKVKEIITFELQNAEISSLLFEAIEAMGDKTYLPLLSQILQSTENDKTTDPDWLFYLKNCIETLKKIK